VKKKKLTKSNIRKKDLTIDVRKLTLKSRNTIKYIGPKFVKYHLVSRDNEDVMQLISDAGNYFVGDDLPVFNPNEVCYHLSERVKEYFINLIDDNDDRILSVKFIDPYAIVKVKAKTKIMYYVFTTEAYQGKKKRGGDG
jgi:hypothetical protein